MARKTRKPKKPAHPKVGPGGENPMPPTSRPKMPPTSRPTFRTPGQPIFTPTTPTNPNWPTARQINQMLSQPLPGKYVESPKAKGRGKKR